MNIYEFSKVITTIFIVAAKWNFFNVYKEFSLSALHFFVHAFTFVVKIIEQKLSHWNKTLKSLFNANKQKNKCYFSIKMCVL